MRLHRFAKPLISRLTEKINKNMREYPKRIKRQIKELAALAYQRELDKEMEKLAKHFDNWRAGKINCFELNELIHKFHNGISQELWKKYDIRHADVMVAMAIVKNIIKKQEVSEETLSHIKDLIDNYSKF